MARIHIRDLPERMEFDEKEMRRILGGGAMISELIRSYLSRHSGAEDTLDGVLNWWKKC